MRVLHVINSLAGGGAEKLLARLLPRLREPGLEVELLLLARTETEEAALLASRGIPVHYARPNSLYSPLQVLSIVGFLRGFDVVHAHLFPSFLWVAMAVVFRPKVVAFYTEHSASNRRRGRGLLRIVDRWAYSRYSRIVCISRGVRESLVRHVRETGARSVVVYNGIDLDKPADKSARSALSNGDCAPIPQAGEVLVCVANFRRGKGHDVLFRALALVPEDVSAVLAGHGPLEKPLRQLSRSLGIEPRVHFLGYVDDVGSLYQSARLCVVPSLTEGFGMAALEAMGCGVPVVASNTPGLAEVVHTAGLLFEAGDPTDLARKILMVLESPALWAELRAKGVERARWFSLERMAGEYRRLYAAVKPVQSLTC